MVIYGSINNYLKQKSLMVQANRNLHSYTPASEREGVISKLTDTLNQVNDSNRMSGILTRMKTGKRLSKADAEYLRKNSPDLYRKYQMIEAEREGHKKNLRRARTKKDASQIQQSKLGQLYNECVGGGPHADAEFNLCRAAAVREEYREYLDKKKKGAPRKDVHELLVRDDAMVNRRRYTGERDEWKPQTKAQAEVSAAGRKKAVAKYKATRQDAV